MSAILFRSTFVSRRIASPCFLFLITLLFAFLASTQSSAAPGDQLLQIGDTVQLSVEGRPDWDLLLVIDEEGRVSIPQVGQVSLAGLTLPDAGSILQQRLRVFDPGLASVEVDLGNSDAMTLQVQGSVTLPGTFSFDSAPSVWDLVRRGGGLQDNADLGMARIIRDESGIARIFPLDLSALVVGGQIPEFEFQSGDILIVPEAEEGTVIFAPGSGTQVFGAVANPSIVQLTSPRLLMDVLMLAGSPEENAKLKEIWLIHSSDGSFLSRKIDLTKFLEKGDLAGNPLVYPGDTIRVPHSEDGWYRRNGPLLLGALTATATTWLAITRITD